ncbi:alginate export family protein [Microbulbifer magnicolonia]|uniref:alginate export family protein n=1 Tax=Microbulbifer magnicolonia TaxID=3109744 RepID=UPI002B40B4D0|nr:alginate export family protein [Microbulbifer sp. GG15]
MSARTASGVTARARLSLLLIALCWLQTAVAQQQLPPLEKLRYEEDYGSLRSQLPLRGWPARWKYLPLDSGATQYLSIGGEIRQRYEYTENPLFGADPQDSHGVWLHRYSILGDLHPNRHMRIFAQLTSAQEAGRAGGPSPVDENKLEWQNAFLDLRGPLTASNELTLRAGRQEVELGSGRLVSVREGPNVRRTFDGVRGLLNPDLGQLSAVALRPREDNPGEFDDSTDSSQALWGLYATSAENLLHYGSLDLYFLGYENNLAEYTQGIDHEDRYSLGGRYWGNSGRWTWNWEALYQYGGFGSGDIHAWTIASETAYRWQSACWQPQLRLSVNIASGDDNLDDPELGTFNPLFPRGNYFSEAAVLGPRNFYNFHTFLDLQPSERWTLTTDINLFWRLTTADGVYSPSGQIIRFAEGSSKRHVASSFSFTAEYTFDRGLLFTAIYTYLQPGSFIRATGPAEDIHFTEVTLQYRF